MSSQGERIPRRVVGALASVVLSLAAGAVASAWVARALGEQTGRALAQVADELAPGVSDGEDGDGPSVLDLVELGGASPIEIPRGDVERVAIAAPSRPVAPARAARPRREESALGILVRASVVRTAIRRGGRPSGSPVTASGDRPAGLVLQGVTGYGTALRDGDLLTRVGGFAATSEAMVVAAVSGAVRSRAKAIDGEIWRAGRRIPFVVELPFRKKRR